MIYTDQLGRKLFLPSKPNRIVSIVPSQTKLLGDLDLDQEVVGLTKFCVEPKHWLNSKVIVGGTKNIHIQRVKDLNPDIVIANKEENTKSDILELEKYFPVWVSDVKDVNSALQMIENVGSICHKAVKAAQLIHTIKDARLQLKKEMKDVPKSVCYLIWKDPFMTVGRDTFIHSILEEVGFKNVFSAHSRYPICSLEEIIAASPDCVFLSSEPYPFKASDINIFRPMKAMLVDGKAFSWYGSHLIETFSYLRTLISQWS